MLTYDKAYRELITSLSSIYDEREAAAIANVAMESITGLDRMQRVIKRDEQISEKQQVLINTYKEKLVIGIPIQYCTNKALFLGHEYYVDENVLIPRPETEELIEWIIEDVDKQASEVLDIGTGSGCIPISLKLLQPQLNITSIDVSSGAINVATKNAHTLNASVAFQKVDFLNKNNWNNLSTYDIIVSNPPYIPENEFETLHTNVRDNEPNEALFVPNDDALLFYRHIAEFGKEHLNNNGAIYCELHVDYAKQTKEMFEHSGYTGASIKEDMNGNLRMLKAIKQ